MKIPALSESFEILTFLFLNQFPQSTTKKFVDKLRRRLSTYGVQEEQFQMVELTRTPGPGS